MTTIEYKPTTGEVRSLLHTLAIYLSNCGCPPPPWRCAACRMIQPFIKMLPNLPTMDESKTIALADIKPSATTEQSDES